MTETGKKALGIIIIGGLLIGGSFFAYSYYDQIKQIKKQKCILRQRKADWQILKQKLTREVAGFKGQAGILVKDLRFNWEISSNKDRLFPSASLAKIPIMAACFLAAEEGRIKLDRQVVLRNSDKLSGSGVLKDIRPGVIFTVEELIGFMICDSDNTATNMLTNLLGIDYLNSVFRTLGLKNTNLSRRIADFKLRDRGIENYTTAKDTALLLEQIYQRSLISKAVSEKCLKILKLQHVNDRIPKYLPVNITVAHKTGLERNVCHDAGIIFGCKGDFLICVLTKHANPNAVASKNFIARVALHTYVYSEQSL
ncbi:MAG TPA: class A beta-lactamase-related serine hydrolase [Candidatus Omnitrophota bacterium]|mgnify:CR=1 FL=1|nr:class A beta-lactamase-related serine hydrolase [Candidatus Omnitrophota bacterium]HPT39596.1 class A beta-lactamase-related serine hydrolase [Candidatus Omnitrophota bacterium]